jgi:hypothetical protein
MSMPLVTRLSRVMFWMDDFSSASIVAANRASQNEERRSDPP